MNIKFDSNRDSGICNKVPRGTNYKIKGTDVQESRPVPIHGTGTGSQRTGSGSIGTGTGSHWRYIVPRKALKILGTRNEKGFFKNCSLGTGKCS